MRIPPKWRQFGYGILGCLMALSLSLPGTVIGPWRHASLAAEAPSVEVQTLLDEGRESFVRGQLTPAANTLQTALATAQANGNQIGEVMVLSNLALVRGQMGNWPEANDTIAASLTLLATAATPAANWQRVQAQTLNVQGRLLLGQGEAEKAFDIWEQAAAVYEGSGDRAGYYRSRLRQARALQALGFYGRAVNEILDPLKDELVAAPASPIKVRSLRELAEALMVAKSLDAARDPAQASLEVAQELDLADEIAATQLTLGNIEYAQARERENQNADAQPSIDAALTWYDLALSNGRDRTLRLQAQLNELALLIEFEDVESAVQRWPEVYGQVIDAAPDQAGIYLRINLANSLEQLAALSVSGAPSWEQVIALLADAQKEATALQDARAEAHVLGYLGKAYKDKGQLEADPAQLQTAKRLTENALFAAQTVNATDISYLWFEQLGDLHQAFGERQAAIAAYDGAVGILKSLRSDLAAVNPEVQFSFQKSIEPLHRKLVDLLLEGDAPPSQANLDEARRVLESLQLEELNNYLQASCLNSQEVSVDEISADNRVAVIYPILLPDKLGIIATLPGTATSDVATKSATAEETAETLKYYSTPLNLEDLEASTRQMLRQLVFVDFAVLDTSEEIYHLLFPDQLLQDLADSLPDTLVFIPDGILRSIPIAALFDGESYLIEKYSIAITPGLQLLNPEPLQQRQLSALTFGLTEAVPGWSALPFVANEIDAIEEHIRVQRFLNDEFTQTAFQKTLSASSAPIVHLATHGKFSSQLDETFIQAWNEDRISVEELSDWLQRDRTEPIELLVMSACETATGDDRAALGLAGMAIRAGARSTVASLWQVDDAATAIFMDRFYEALADQSGNKAEALQSAQKHLIEDFVGDFDHPYYWAPFILLGNWL